ncbi:lipocalin-like domain-containing protein [Paracoccus aerodenitrificans]|uniref:lipocalin-like domain-containing protein n=1 Tax=Paracoccus aerodenitrificans TaxID=3017781 RepID=UPI003EB993C6
MNRRIFLLAALSAPQLRAQGFAGLGETSDGYGQPDPDRPVTFPRDHAPHPDYRIEWWYLTAPLSFADGTLLGVQWTLFRSALTSGAESSGTGPSQAWLGHAAVTTADTHRVAERYARGGTGQAGASGQPFEAWIDEWTMRGETPEALRLTAGGTDFRYDLQLRAEGPLIRHGKDGFSVKSSAGQASYYYSQPFYRVRGTVDLGNGPKDVIGQGWLDREWSSQPLAEDQSGWDWFSLNLDDGRRIMAFRLRGAEDYLSCTLIDRDGNSMALDNDQIILRAGRRRNGVPVNWTLTLARHDIFLTIEALNPDAWMTTRIPYWEGPVSISGSASGRGYLEMTGYERRG